MRRYLLIVFAIASLLVTASSAQAVVVNDGGTHAGVTLIPGTGSKLPGGMAVTSSPPCTDPWLSSDFSLPSSALCYQGGSVIHRNETFALTWDSAHSYWQTTRGYIEQFLRDVAGGSGTLSSPYAVTTQYRDSGGRAGNSSVFGGGCIDYGNAGGSACDFSSSGVAGHDYPANGCTPTGGSYSVLTNSVCLTDAQLQGEVAAMVTQSGVLGRTASGFTPLIVMLVPPGVETCIDSGGNVCSANSDSTKVKAQFCTYHSEVNVGGTDVAYVVQPWTPYTGCDEPKLPNLPDGATPQQVSVDAGARIVSPLSEGHISALTNPGLNGWVALDGSEVSDDGGCGPAGYPYDRVFLGSSSQNPYYLDREFDNGGAIEPDPNTYFGCVPNVILSPAFVVPSAVNPGDVLELDGSATATSLLVPNAGYQWDFGDGTTTTGPSVEHIYSKPGNYAVKLTVTDRGGNVASLSQPVTVVGANGQPLPGSNPASSSSLGLRVHLQLLPQSLRTVLRRGVTLRVSSNEPADGIATLTITRAAAKRAHIKVGRGPSVLIGRGTVSGVKNGSVNLHLHLSPAIAARLARLRHVAITIHLTLIAANRGHVTAVVAGRY